jgi:hypothetical protein
MEKDTRLGERYCVQLPHKVLAVDMVFGAEAGAIDPTEIR